MAFGMYEYKNPVTGETFSYGDPTINRGNIEGQGLEFVQGPTGSEVDPLIALRTPAPEPTPVSRYTNPAADTTSLFPESGRTFEAGDEEKIRETERRRVQSAIDAINESIAGELSRARIAGAGRLGKTRAMGAAFGLTGSPTGEAQRQETERLNTAEEKEIEASRRLQIETTLGRADDRAAAEIIARRDLAQKNQEKYLTFLSGQKDEARKDIETLAKAGANIEKNTDVYNRLMKQSGYDPLTFDSILNYHKKQGEKIDYKSTYDSERGELILFGIDPKTQQPVFKTYKTEVSKDETFKEVDGVPYAMKKDDKGNISLRKIEGFTPGPEKALDIEAKRAEIEARRAGTKKTEAETRKLEQEIGGAGGVGKDKVLEQLGFVRGAIQRAKDLSGASGRTGALRKAGRFFTGTDDYTNLVSETNTIRTNILTLTTDPSIKKFFGPQMSEADVRLMTSAGTTINPELQDPKPLKDELIRLENLMIRLTTIANAGGGGAGGGEKTGTIEERATERGFDIAAARTAGYTDEEIETFIGQ